MRLVYVPGAILVTPLVRDSGQSLLEYVGPALVLSVFISGANCIEDQADVLSVLSISLLSIIELYR